MSEAGLLVAKPERQWRPEWSVLGVSSGQSKRDLSVEGASDFGSRPALPRWWAEDILVLSESSSEQDGGRDEVSVVTSSGSQGPTTPLRVVAGRPAKPERGDVRGCSRSAQRQLPGRSGLEMPATAIWRRCGRSSRCRDVSAWRQREEKVAAIGKAKA